MNVLRLTPHQSLRDSFPCDATQTMFACCVVKGNADFKGAFEKNKTDKQEFAEQNSY